VLCCVFESNIVYIVQRSCSSVYINLLYKQVIQIKTSFVLVNFVCYFLEVCGYLWYRKASYYHPNNLPRWYNHTFGLSFLYHLCRKNCFPYTTLNTLKQ